MVTTTTIKNIPAIKSGKAQVFDFEKDADKLREWLEYVEDMLYVKSIEGKDRKYKSEKALDTLLATNAG